MKTKNQIKIEINRTALYINMLLLSFCNLIPTLTFIFFHSAFLNVHASEEINDTKNIEVFGSKNGNMSLAQVINPASNVQLTILDGNYRFEDVYIPKSKSFFNSKVSFDKGFSIYKIVDDNNNYKSKYFIAFTDWKDGERSSSHGIIDTALRGLLTSEDYKKIRTVIKGYLRPADGHDNIYLIYDISSTNMYNDNKLFTGSEEVKNAFIENVGFAPDFPPMDAYDCAMEEYSKDFMRPAMTLRMFWNNWMSKHYSSTSKPTR
ncbi:MAG: hypothetical protein HQK49_16430 [Oligoflexia bacterium]|nr:hypothetical protein [Oligoflexia bacterium]